MGKRFKFTKIIISFLMLNIIVILTTTMVHAVSYKHPRVIGCNDTKFCRGDKYGTPIVSYLSDAEYVSVHTYVNWDKVMGPANDPQRGTWIFMPKWDLSSPQWLARSTTLKQDSIKECIDKLNKIRERNEHIKLLTYNATVEQLERFLPINDPWWRLDNRNRIPSWPGCYEVDMSNIEYRETTAAKALALKNAGICDGMFYDVIGSTMSRGSVQFLSDQRSRLGNNWIMQGNTDNSDICFNDPEFARTCNGPLLEGWNERLYNTEQGFDYYKTKMLYANSNYRQVNNSNWLAQYNEALIARSANIGIASACIFGEGFYGNAGILMPAMKAPLGEAIDSVQTSPKADGTYRRAFTNGVAVVNPPGNTPVTISFATTYKNWSTNEVGNSFILHARDGAIFTPDAAVPSHNDTIILDGIDGFQLTGPLTWSAPSVCYGGWVYENNDSNFYYSNYNVSNTTNDEFSVAFHGTNAKIYGKKGTDCGKVDVYIDKVFTTTLDFYNLTNQYKTVLYDTGTLTHGNHQIKFVLRSDKNNSATDKKVYLDYWQYTNVVETLPAPVIKNAFNSRGSLHIEWNNVIPGGSDNPTKSYVEGEFGAGYYVMWGTTPGTYNHKIDVGYVTSVDFGPEEGIEDNKTYYVKVVPYTPERKDGNSATATAYYRSCPDVQTIFTYQMPYGNAVSGSPDQYELGTEFNVSVPGYITKIRFFSNTQEDGDHTARIWDATSNTCVAGPYTINTISGEKTGWREYILASPLKVVPGRIYTVSVSTTSSDKKFMYKPGLFNSNINAGYITGIKGVYTTAIGSRPSNDSGNCYFRDVVFIPEMGQSIHRDQVPGFGWQYSNQIELGTIFKANVAGKISAVRLYSYINEGGDHIVRIWRNSDNTLIAGPFTWNFNTGTQGWRTFALPQPIAINENADYTVSITTSGDKYAMVTSGFFANPVNNSNLVTYTGSGVYTYSIGTRPTSVEFNNGYFRDIIFIPSKEQTIYTYKTPSAAWTYSAQAEFGTIFKPNVNGKITAVRFYACDSEGGNHTVRIWKNSDNTLIAGPITWSVASGTQGWKEYTLKTPVQVAANNDYTVVVSTSTDCKSVYQSGYFSNSYNNGNLITYSGSGVFTYSLGTRPTSVEYNNAYFRDIVFIPD